MKTITTCAALGAYLVASSVSLADCLSPIPRYSRMRIEACTSAIGAAQSAAVDQGFTESEMAAVTASAGRISIVRASLVSEREYILLATDVDKCEKNYLGKTPIFDATSFTRCRDVLVSGSKETDALYLLDLPVLTHFWGEEQLETAPGNLLEAHR